MLKEKLAKELNIPKSELPTIQIIGNIVMLKFKKTDNEVLIAKKLKELMPQIKTICKIKRIKHEFRKPEIKILMGKNTETIHKENGILYALDVSKIMFSKGNAYERHRIANYVLPNEIVVDMFAGIGYFTLPIAKKAKKVYAIEKNPFAFKYLLKNIKLNNLKNVVPIFADCRCVNLLNIADRIIMGYLFEIEKFIPYALKFAKKCSTLHIHTINEFDKNIIKRCGYKIINIKCRKVKSYAPKKIHNVFDVVVNKV